MNRALLILCLGALLLAAGRRALFHVPADQVTSNQLAWNRMGDAERERMRSAWIRVSSSRGVERETLSRRMETLSRLLVAHRRRTDRLPDAATLRAELAAMPERMSLWLDGLGPSEGNLSERIERRTSRRLTRFLQNQEATGRFDPEQIERIRDLPLAARIDAGLELKKQEEIFFLAEVFRDDTQALELTDELSDVEPLQVVERGRDERRRQGFLGRASSVLGLSAEDRARLDLVPDEELVALLRELMSPKVAAHLRAKGVSEDRIQGYLAKPYRELERALDALERGETTRR